MFYVEGRPGLVPPQGRIQEIEKGGSGVMRARCARKFLHLIRPLLVDHTHLIPVGESLDLTVWSSFVPSTLPGLSSG